MIAESLSDKEGREEMVAWIKTMFGKLETRISFLGAVYKNNLDSTRDPINEVKKLMAE
jgi:hypothetical protein